MRERPSFHAEAGAFAELVAGGRYARLSSLPVALELPVVGYIAA